MPKCSAINKIYLSTHLSRDKRLPGVGCVHDKVRDGGVNWCPVHLLSTDQQVLDVLQHSELQYLYEKRYMIFAFFTPPQKNSISIVLSKVAEYHCLLKIHFVKCNLLLLLFSLAKNVFKFVGLRN